MNIFKTFETYLKEPLSILRENFIQIIGIQTGNFFKDKSSIDVQFTENKTQITVINNDKLYNLLSLVNHRTKKKAQNGEKEHESA